MQTKELLAMANQQAYALTMPLLEDLRTAPLVAPTPGGNHAHWVLGHLLVSEGNFLTMMRGGEHPFAALQSQFGGKSVPDATGASYRSFDELLSELKAQQQAVMSMLETLTEEELDQPSRNCPPGFEAFFGTWRQVLLMRPMHWMTHRGQLADARKAAGREPLFA